MSVLADFATGEYTIINSLHRNRAALLNGNADESIRGVFPVGVGKKNEMVGRSAAVDRVILILLCSGTSSIAVTVNTASRTLSFRNSLGAVGADIVMVN